MSEIEEHPTRRHAFLSLPARTECTGPRSVLPLLAESPGRCARGRPAGAVTAAPAALEAAFPPPKR